VLVPGTKMCISQLLMTSTCLLILSVANSTEVEHAAEFLTNNPGHLKPFGSSGPFIPLDEIDGFPTTSVFFKQYVLPMRPLKMNGAGRLSGAFHLWSDDYFLSSTVSNDSTIAVETAKKENRTNPILHMHFQEFVQTYNVKNLYMVDRVPDEFRYDNIKMLTTSI
jgi:hypothetical protein